MGREQSGKPKGWVEPIEVGGRKVERVQLKLDAAGYLALRFLTEAVKENKPANSKTGWFREGIIILARRFGYDAEQEADRHIKEGTLPDFGEGSQQEEDEEVDAVCDNAPDVGPDGPVSGLSLMVPGNGKSSGIFV